MGFDDEVKREEAALRGEGWADFTSLSRELAAWGRLADEVSIYRATVDDYTNDLCSRDYLAALMTLRRAVCVACSKSRSLRSTRYFERPRSRTRMNGWGSTTG